MPDKPAAEISVDERLIRSLLQSQAPSWAALPLHHAADGWDCSVWRLGPAHAVRLARRAIADDLVRREQRWLPELAPVLERSGVRVPTPLVAGDPTASYPWAWSVVPWIDGCTGLEIPRARRTGWVAPLARTLHALHVPAPAGAPRSPFRGGPLAERDEPVSARFAALADAGLDVAPLTAAWRAGVAAPAWPGPAVWVHGDLHPGNVVADEGGLAGIVDFGDLTTGDPAYDLAIAWLAFGPVDRAAFQHAIPQDDDATWTRARAWAAAVAGMLLYASDDAPAYAALGAEAAAEIAADAGGV